MDQVLNDDGCAICPECQTPIHCCMVSLWNWSCRWCHITILILMLWWQAGLPKPQLLFYSYLSILLYNFLFFKFLFLHCQLHFTQFSVPIFIKTWSTVCKIKHKVSLDIICCQIQRSEGLKQCCLKRTARDGTINDHASLYSRPWLLYSVETVVSLQWLCCLHL